MVNLDASVLSTPPTFVDDGPASPGAASLPLPTLPLPIVSAGSDLGAAIAALAIQNGQLQHTEANDDRNAQEALARSDADAEVQALRSEASSIGNQAWMDGALAAFQASAGGKSQALGSVLAGVKGAGDGLYSADQKTDEANAKGFEAGVNVANEGADGAHDAISGADQLVQAALDFYREYVSTAAQTANAAAGRA